MLQKTSSAVGLISLEPASGVDPDSDGGGLGGEVGLDGDSMELPHWTDIVKTGRFKELAPYDPDWIYGGSKRNGPPHFCKSSGAVARHILQQLQTMNIIDIDVKGRNKRIKINQIIITNLPWLLSNEDETCESKPKLFDVMKKSDGQNEEEEISVSGTLGCCSPGNAHFIPFLSSSPTSSDCFSSI
ncbi:40S ribosomal protein S19-3 [Camellia lanceoleosa]|uniref:40S ribosomal protein S19-3 n=1 Tax=Camellia lanceoleosa TaxID=1840588 RepID=A0ACC0FAC0_9ERIC|nr:40S ribosomal protein S19-3 [Camellia lanceoleosa]